MKFQIEKKAKESAVPSEIVDLQREMKDILRFQIEHEEKEYGKKDEGKTSVKLPKLDLISFSSDKA